MTLAGHAGQSPQTAGGKTVGTGRGPSLSPDRSGLNPDSATLSGPPPIYKRGSGPPCKASGGITDKLAKHLELRAGIPVSAAGGPGVRQSPLGCEGCESYPQRGDNRLSRDGFFTLKERDDIRKVPENASITPSCPGSLRMEILKDGETSGPPRKDTNA